MHPRPDETNDVSLPRSAGDRPWIVGLDLAERSLGALVVGHWLGEGEGGTVGVYVLEAWIRPYLAAGFLPAVERIVAHAAAQQGVPPPSRSTVLETGHAEDGLARAAETAAGLVIGRAARTDGVSLVRLGRVARRLLRVLPGPVVVVPRDLAAVPPGPIVLATDLGEATSAALSFAQRLATRCGRPLELVHVGERQNHALLDEHGLDWAAYQDEYRAQVERTFEEWSRAHHLGRAPRHVAYGDAVMAIAEIAAERQAALVVVGSRRLGTAERIFLGSTASGLAGMATCPVAVVPPA